MCQILERIGFIAITMMEPLPMVAEKAGVDAGQTGLPELHGEDYDGDGPA